MGRVSFFLGIKQTGFLIYGAAIFQHINLTIDLIFNGLPDEADGVDVFGLGAGAPGIAGAAHRHIDIGAHGTFVHIAITSAQIAQYGTQLGDIGARFFRWNAYQG